MPGCAPRSRRVHRRNPAYTTPEEFDKFQRAEIVKWGKVIREAKLQPQ
jgi:tripartite-type tricarboxylate transporter receptor subunit TctC